MNNLKKIREERMLSKAELASKSQLSVLTIGRIERGLSCHPSTKRKILGALGIKIADHEIVFPKESTDERLRNKVDVEGSDKGD